MNVTLSLLPLLLAAAPAEAPAPLALDDGDRVVFVGNTLLERDRHYGRFETMFRSRFPGKKFIVRNLAWPGDTVTVQLRPSGFGSLEQHVGDLKPTVLFVSFGTNESFAGEPGLAGFVDGYRKLLDKLAKTKAKIVLVSPIRHEALGPPLPDPAAHNRNLKLYVDATAKLAKEHGYRFVDLFTTVVPESSEPAKEPLTDNGIHLNQVGYWKAAEVLAEQLGWGPNRWQGEADVKMLDRLELKVTARLLPTPAPEGKAELDRVAGQRVLKLLGPKAGKWTLSIDGQKVAEADAAEWARGVVLTDGPEFRQARAVRTEAVWKEVLFFHRWRAHNGEYIYGSRSKPGGGNAGNPSFPIEMAEFDRLLDESDQRLAELSKPAPHTYELTGP